MKSQTLRMSLWRCEISSNRTAISDGFALILRSTFSLTQGDKRSYKAKRSMPKARGGVLCEASRKMPLRSCESSIASRVWHADELQNPRTVLALRQRLHSYFFYFILFCPGGIHV